jgi:hypothetical protein
VGDARSADPWRPLPRPELLEVDVPSASCRKEQLGVEPDRKLVEHVDDPLAERHTPPLSARFGARLQPEVVTIGEVVKIGADLKAKLELLARRENGDATWLARCILRDWLERRSGAAVALEPTEPKRRG